MSKPDAGVTVESIRAANGKLMTNARGTPLPAPPSQRVTSQLKDVAEAGQRAMRDLKRQ